MATAIELLVNGSRYGGWERARVSRTIEAISGGFELEVSEKWANQNQRWILRQGDRCEILIGQSVLVGYIERRSLSYGPDGHTVTVSGRDATGVLVDSSAMLGKWEFHVVTALDICERVCKPHGISVKLDPSLDPKAVSLSSSGKSRGRSSHSGKLPKAHRKFSIDPGMSCFEVIATACRMAGLLPVSDGQGGLLLTQAGTTRALTNLVQGENTISASADFSSHERYARYVVSGQRQATDEDYGVSATAVKGEAEDMEVADKSRVLLIRQEGNLTAEYAKTRAQWESTIRAGRSGVLNVTVQGWTQTDGTIWPVNALVSVKSPLLDLGDAAVEMLIVSTTFQIDDNGGSTTELKLMRPSAFTLEPILKPAGANVWGEIRGGL